MTSCHKAPKLVGVFGVTSRKPESPANRAGTRNGLLGHLGLRETLVELCGPKAAALELEPQNIDTSSKTSEPPVKRGAGALSEVLAAS